MKRVSVPWSFMKFELSPIQFVYLLQFSCVLVVYFNCGTDELLLLRFFFNGCISFTCPNWLAFVVTEIPKVLQLGSFL